MREITDKEFFELSKTDSIKVFDGPHGVVLVKCYLWVLEEVSNELTNIEFYKINVDENQEAAGEYGINVNSYITCDEKWWSFRRKNEFTNQKKH